MIKYNITFNNVQNSGGQTGDYVNYYYSRSCNCSLAGTDTCKNCSNNPNKLGLPITTNEWNSGTFQLTDPQKEKLKKLLEELANTPLLKIPFWIEAHKKELEELGISVKPDVEDGDEEEKK